MHRLIHASHTTFRTACPQARLRLQAPQFSDEAQRSRFTDRLHAASVDVGRVDLLGPVPREAYFNAYAEVDILLDTFPYPGITTTCEALWMGVPTVTLLGQTMLSRQGGSLLTCVGLQEWVTESTQGYVDTAILMAGDVASLQALRANLRALYALMGGDQSNMRHWIKTANSHLGDASPMERMGSVAGLVEVMQYLDAIRGKV